MKQTSIYALHDPRDWSIRYVGKANNPEIRHGRRRSHNHQLQMFLSELRALGLKPRVTILQTCSVDQWQIWERFWIATVKAAGEQLLNLHPGGDGAPGANPWNKGKTLSVEYRQKLSEAHKGQKPSLETKAKLAAVLAARGGAHNVPHSDEAKEKMRAAKLGKKQTPEHCAKVRAALTGKKRPPFSAEWKQNLRLAQLKRWAAKKNLEVLR